MEIPKYRIWDKRNKKMIYKPMWIAFNTKTIGFGDGGTISFDDVVIYPYVGNKQNIDLFVGDIIEGNLIKYHLPTMGEVIYCPEYSAYANKNEGGKTLLFEIDSIKVVGNVHENKDLT